MDRVAPVLFAAAARTLRPALADRWADAAEDVVQDAFVRLLRDDARLLRAYDPARASLVTWLTIVARSVALDHLRRRRSATVDAAAAEAVADVAAPPDEPADARPVSAAVPLHLLTERQRLVLHLLYDQGLAVDEVARLLGVDAQTVRSTRHKALERLRAHFGTGPPP